MLLSAVIVAGLLAAPRQSDDAKVQAWIKELSSEDPAAREQAEGRLADQGTAIEPLLKEALDGADAEVRPRLRRLLDIIGVRRRMKLSASLVKAFPSIYARLAGRPEDHLALLEELASQDKLGRYRYHGSLIFGDVGELEGEILRTYGGLDRRLDALLRLLDKIAHDKGALPDDPKERVKVFVDQLGDADDGRREDAVRRLAEIEARDAAPAIAKLMRDPSSAVRKAVGFALGDFEYIEAIPAFAEILSSPEVQRRADAIEALGHLKARAHEAAIAKFLVDAAPEVRYAAVIALTAMGAKDRGAEIAKLLKDPCCGIREEAARGLGDLGSVESAAAMLPLLEDPEESVRVAAVKSLARLHAREAIPGVLKMLNEPGWQLKCAAAECLGDLDAKDAVPALMPLLKDDESLIRATAVGALLKLGAKGAVSAELLEEYEKMTREHGAVR